jgi:hypothetical protein
MAHTFTNLLTHVIFSTKDRLPLLTPDLREDMLAYMGGKVSFQEEFIDFLKRHGIAYDERYIWE